MADGTGEKKSHAFHTLSIIPVIIKIMSQSSIYILYTPTPPLFCRIFILQVSAALICKWLSGNLYKRQTMAPFLHFKHSTALFYDILPNS